MSGNLCEAHLVLKFANGNKRCHVIATKRIMDSDKVVVSLCLEHFNVFVRENLENVRAVRASSLKEALEGEP